MSTAPLFRKEVFDAKRDAWLGRAQIVQPLPVRLMAVVSVGLVAAIVLYVRIGTYTRSVHAAGVLIPDTGLITVASPVPGIVTDMAASEGERVRKGQLLYVISRDATSSSGPTQQRVIAQLRAQKATIEKERDLHQSMAALQKKALVDQLSNLASQHLQLEAQTGIEGQTIALLKAKADQLKGAVRRGVVSDPEFENQNYLLMQAVAQKAVYVQSSLQIEGKIDAVARLGGDEFGILYRCESVEETAVLARRIIERIVAAYRLDGVAVGVSVGVSIGIAIAPRDGVAADQLLRNADMAMYQAKAAGRRTYRFFGRRLIDDET